MKPLLLLLGVCMIILLSPSVLPAVNQFRSTTHTEEHGNIITAAGVTSANVTLAEDLFGDRTSEVTSLTSSLTGDYPISSTYATSSNKLLVTGLVASENRTLTVVYNIGRLDDYVGVDVTARTWPMFLALGVIGIVAAAIYNATRQE